MAGRPTDKTPELLSAILAAIAEGNSLRKICSWPEMPSTASVFLWMSQDLVFSEQYARACEERADAIFEESLEIADDGKNDWMERNDPKNEGYAFNGEHVQRSRLRVDTRKWFLSKMNPKKYGDKQVIEHGVAESLESLVAGSLAKKA